MKAAFFEVKDWEAKYLAERLPDVECVFETGRLDGVKLEQLTDVDALSVFIYSRVNAQVIERMPKLRLVATRSTGYDHVDVAACRRRGIAVSNVPTYGENTVAEHTFALILMLSRKVHESYARAREGNVELAMLTGFDLQGKTRGVIGAGRIGLHVVRIGRGFGMRVLAYDKRRDPFLAELMSFTYTTLERLLEESDIVTLHCPLTEETKHLIGREDLARMRKGALLINTARGGLVDTDALVEALDNGKLGGVGLDVLEGEELIKEEKQLLYEKGSVEKLRTALRTRVLLERKDVVFTPHNAFNSREALVRILDTTIENVRAGLGGEPVNTVG